MKKKYIYTDTKCNAIYNNHKIIKVQYDANLGRKIKKHTNQTNRLIIIFFGLDSVRTTVRNRNKNLLR